VDEKTAKKVKMLERKLVFYSTIGWVLYCVVLASGIFLMVGCLLGINRFTKNKPSGKMVGKLT